VLRNELKFSLSLPSALILEKRLSAVLSADTHTASNGAYQIRSLYFDDPHHAAFYDKLNGLEKREKFRIRFYNRDLSFIRLEKKEKRGNQSLKSGITVHRDLAEELITCGDLPRLAAFPLNEMCHKIRSEAFRPLLFVDYTRKAFLYPAGNVRITLDSHLFASPFRSSLLDETGRVPVLEQNEAILEVKFDSFLPPFISELLYDVPKINVAISKYCKCYQMLNGEYV
jgi:SPX domain protein involved in polyphosphate accumulation